MGPILGTVTRSYRSQLWADWASETHDDTKKYGMDVGPVDVVILSFRGNEFNGEIEPAIVDLVARGIVRLLDVLFVTKDAEGNVRAMALADLGEDLGTVIAASRAVRFRPSRPPLTSSTRPRRPTRRRPRLPRSRPPRPGC